MPKLKITRQLNIRVQPRDIFVTVYLSLLFIIGLFGNSLVFFGMVLNHTQMVTASHVYAIHMAFADLLLILVLPLKISQYLNHEGTRIDSIDKTA